MLKPRGSKHLSRTILFLLNADATFPMRVRNGLFPPTFTFPDRWLSSEAFICWTLIAAKGRLSAPSDLNLWTPWGRATSWRGGVDEKAAGGEGAKRLRTSLHCECWKSPLGHRDLTEVRLTATCSVHSIFLCLMHYCVTLTYRGGKSCSASERSLRFKKTRVGEKGQPRRWWGGYDSFMEQVLKYLTVLPPLNKLISCHRRPLPK